MRFYAPAYFRDGCLRRHPVLLPACRLSPLPVSSLRGSKDHAPRERRQPARALSLRVSRGEERRGEGGGGRPFSPQALAKTSVRLPLFLHGGRSAPCLPRARGEPPRPLTAPHVGGREVRAVPLAAAGAKKLPPLPSPPLLPPNPAGGRHYAPPPYLPAGRRRSEPDMTADRSTLPPCLALPCRGRPASLARPGHSFEQRAFIALSSAGGRRLCEKRGGRWRGGSGAGP